MLFVRNERTPITGRINTTLFDNDMVTLKDGVMPAFLMKPNDPFSQMFFGKDQIEVSDTRCGYRVEINGELASSKPAITARQDFELDETHVFSKPGGESWYVLRTIKDTRVKTSPLRDSVEHPYELSRLMRVHDPMVAVPEGFDTAGYRSRGLVIMGSNAGYNEERKLDETIVYCHVFSFGARLFKDFILCARKGIFSWKLEVVIGTEKETIGTQDFVPPGYLFGSFRPIAESCDSQEL